MGPGTEATMGPSPASRSDVNVRVTVLAFMIALAFVPHRASASAAPETLTAQVVALDPHDHAGLLKAIDELAPRPDSLRGRAAWIMTYALQDAEATCRSGLLSKDDEPGSPTLSWRHLAYLRADSCSWYVGALSCWDSLCGAQVTHDRLALLCVCRATSRIFILPVETPSIGEPDVQRVDSAAIFRAPDHALIQARRQLTNDHPCWWGPDGYEVEKSDFVVVRGDQLLQAFTLDVSSDASSHDDENGGSGTSVTVVIDASAAVVRMDSKRDEWEASPDLDPNKTVHHLSSSRARLEYSRATHRFIPVE